MSKTKLELDGTQFFINGEVTYRGRSYRGQSLEGLLFNSRMIQAVFDDENPETAKLLAYPDTGTWDAERNTDEFCAVLPVYKRHGLLAFTVGLQGGGSSYAPEVYGHYQMSAFAADGTLKKPYFDRLRRVLKRADDLGMVVIVSYLYVASLRHLDGQAGVDNAVQNATDWLLQTGFENIIVEVMNEVRAGVDGRITPDNVPRYLEMVKGTTLNGRPLSGRYQRLPRQHDPDRGVARG